MALIGKDVSGNPLDDCVLRTPNEFTIMPDGTLDLTTHIKYKKLNNLAKEPTRGSAAAAGYDLYAAIDKEMPIPPHMTVKIGTGLSFALPDNTFAAIFARSGLATKFGVRPANCVGVCDSDYRGEYIVALHNDTNDIQVVEPGDRIAQMILLPYIPMTFEEVDNLDNTDRGGNGFGSTGV